MPPRSLAIIKSNDEIKHKRTLLFGSTLAPVDAYGWLNKYARGNQISCNVIGFIGHGSRVSSVLYNGALTLCYLLTIRYNWKEYEL